MNRLEMKHGLYLMLLFTSCKCLHLKLTDDKESGSTGNPKVEKNPIELQFVVLHLALVTFTHKFPTQCTEEEVLGRAAM